MVQIIKAKKKKKKKFPKVKGSVGAKLTRKKTSTKAKTYLDIKKQRAGVKKQFYE